MADEQIVGDGPGVMEFQYDLAWRRDLTPTDADRLAESMTTDPIVVINPAAREQPLSIKDLYRP